MDISMEWNIICRICLQEGDMISIFEMDEGMVIADKIMQCSDLKIDENQNLPQQICAKCLSQLRVAYNFRTNCESSNKVLEAFAKANVSDSVVCSVKGIIYKYEPPAGLNVKRIRKASSPPIKVEDSILDPLKHVTIEPKLELTEDDEIIVAEDFDEIVLDQPRESPVQFETSEIEEYISEDTAPTLPTRIVVVPPRKRSVPRKSSATTKHNRSKLDKPLCICELCGNSFKYKHALETHMRRHRNEKPFSCEICGRSFVLNVELTCHMRTHTGQKPYACRYCDRRFSDFGSRIKHERSHTGERPYACETCGKAFAYSYGLSSHILTHTGEKPHKCGKCGKCFTKKHHVTNHLKTHLKHEQKLKAQQFLDSRAKNDSDHAVEVIEYNPDDSDNVEQQVTLIDGEVDNAEFETYDVKPVMIFESDDENKTEKMS